MLKVLRQCDLETIFSWRNAPNVRRAMYSQREITWNEHMMWFEGLKVDDSRQCFLYLNRDNEQSGVVYFKDLNFVHDTAFWGFYANPHARPGTGMRMSLEALDHAFLKLRIKKLIADVLASNSRSVEMHKRVGFVEEGCFREQYSVGKQRIDVIRLGILSNEWWLMRDSLENRLVQLDTDRMDSGS